MFVSSTPYDVPLVYWTIDTSNAIAIEILNTVSPFPFHATLIVQYTFYVTFVSVWEEVKLISISFPRIFRIISNVYDRCRTVQMISQWLHRSAKYFFISSHIRFNMCHIMLDSRIRSLCFYHEGFLVTETLMFNTLGSLIYLEGYLISGTCWFPWIFGSRNVPLECPEVISEMEHPLWMFHASSPYTC